MAIFDSTSYSNRRPKKVRFLNLKIRMFSDSCEGVLSGVLENELIDFAEIEVFLYLVEIKFQARLQKVLHRLVCRRR